MSRRLRIAIASLVLLMVAMLATGCSDPWQRPHASPSAVGEPGAGFLPEGTPGPESTVTPSPGSWSDVRPSAGYRVVLVSGGDDDQTRVLTAGVQEWAKDERVDLRTVKATGDPIDDISRAIDLGPDLIVSAGNGVIDALALITASHLDQDFLIIGAEVAEPTHNVTAVCWEGASFRGEGLPMASAYDPDSFTPERVGRAMRAGTTAVLTGTTGIIVWID